MVIILIIFILSSLAKGPLTLLIKASIRAYINFKQSLIALSEPPDRSSNDL